MGKNETKMNKPVYLRQTILDLSTMLMYEFHYEYMLHKYGIKVRLCYMDIEERKPCKNGNLLVLDVKIDEQNLLLIHLHKANTEKIN